MPPVSPSSTGPAAAARVDVPVAGLLVKLFASSHGCCGLFRRVRSTDGASCSSDVMFISLTAKA